MMGQHYLSNPCRGCPVNICLTECEKKRAWADDRKKGFFPSNLSNFKRREA